MPEKVQSPNDSTACLFGLRTAPSQVEVLKDKPLRDGYLGVARLAYGQAEPGGKIEAAIVAEIEALEALAPDADPSEEVAPAVAAAIPRLEEACVGRLR